MKTIPFQEIIECSSQQSILTGQAGFGIRTFTEGMDERLVQDICEQINCAYEIGLTEQVTNDDIVHNAEVTKKYPRTLKYMAFKDEGGNDKHIIACSTYIGIDYGYFCGLESARRAGTNYIADILVFDEKPDIDLFPALLDQQVFLPIDNTCSPDNPELKMLLTGEPAYLKKRSVNLKENSQNTINEQTALVAIALIQAKINEKADLDKSLQYVVFQSKEANVASILNDFTKLPKELTEGKFFQTNYLQGYGMPNGYQMLFLNEHNKEEFYTDNYVYVNLDEKSFKNVDSGNACFAQMTKAATQHDRQQFYALIELCLHQEVSLLTVYLKDQSCDAATLEAMHDILGMYFSHKIEIDKAQGIHKLYHFAQTVGTEVFESLQLMSLVNSYANECYLHPDKTDIESANYFLCGPYCLDDVAETYLEIICRLSRDSKNINGTYWEWIIAKRLGLSLKDVRMKIYEKFLAYLAAQKQELDMTKFSDYLNDSYSSISPEEQKEESMLMLDAFWNIFSKDKDTCEKATTTLIETMPWNKKDIKAYLVQCKNDAARKYVKKHYSFWESITRKLFK